MDWAIPYGAHTGPRNILNGQPTGKDPSNSDGLPIQNYLSGRSSCLMCTGVACNSISTFINNRPTTRIRPVLLSDAWRGGRVVYELFPIPIQLEKPF